MDEIKDYESCIVFYHWSYLEEICFVVYIKN